MIYACYNWEITFQCLQIIRLKHSLNLLKIKKITLKKLHINKQLTIRNRSIPIINNLLSSFSNPTNNKLSKLLKLTS